MQSNLEILRTYTYKYTFFIAFSLSILLIITWFDNNKVN